MSASGFSKRLVAMLALNVACAVLNLAIAAWNWRRWDDDDIVCAREDRTAVAIQTAACMCGEDLWDQDGVPITTTPTAEACTHEARLTICAHGSDRPR